MPIDTYTRQSKLITPVTVDKKSSPSAGGGTYTQRAIILIAEQRDFCASLINRVFIKKGNYLYIDIFFLALVPFKLKNSWLCARCSNVCTRVRLHTRGKVRKG